MNIIIKNNDLIDRDEEAPPNFVNKDNICYNEIKEIIYTIIFIILFLFVFMPVTVIAVCYKFNL